MSVDLCVVRERERREDKREVRGIVPVRRKMRWLQIRTYQSLAK